MAPSGVGGQLYPGAPHGSASSCRVTSLAGDPRLELTPGTATPIPGVTTATGNPNSAATTTSPSTVIVTGGTTTATPPGGWN